MVPYYRHNDRGRKTGIIDQTAFRTDLCPFIGLILGKTPASPAVTVVPVPVYQVVGESGDPYKFIFELPEERAGKFKRKGGGYGLPLAYSAA